MKLTDLRSGNFNAAEWEAKGYLLPKFDMAAVAKKTYDEPTWVHFGGGNIFRAFPAAILNDALNTGKYDRGVIVAETMKSSTRPMPLMATSLWLFRSAAMAPLRRKSSPA